MSDDKSLTGQDRELISLEQDYERRDWAERLYLPLLHATLSPKECL